MRRIALLLLIVTLAGCKSTVGPLASKHREDKPDPLYTSSEQKSSWVRERFPLLEDNRNVSPLSYTNVYGPTGR